MIHEQYTNDTQEIHGQYTSNTCAELYCELIWRFFVPSKPPSGLLNCTGSLPSLLSSNILVFVMDTRTPPGLAP